MLFHTWAIAISQGLWYTSPGVIHHSCSCVVRNHWSGRKGLYQILQHKRPVLPAFGFLNVDAEEPGGRGDSPGFGDGHAWDHHPAAPLLMICVTSRKVPNPSNPSFHVSSMEKIAPTSWQVHCEDWMRCVHWYMRQPIHWGFSKWGCVSSALWAHLPFTVTLWGRYCHPILEEGKPRLQGIKCLAQASQIIKGPKRDLVPVLWDHPSSVLDHDVICLPTCMSGSFLLWATPAT